MRTRRAAVSVLGAVAGPLGCASPFASTQSDASSFTDDLMGPLLAESAWRADPTLPSIDFAHWALHLRSSPTQSAYIRALFLPRGDPADVDASAERLMWTARIVLRGGYFIVLDAELGGLPLRIQVTPYGAHVTTTGRDRVTRGIEVQLLPGWSDAARHWRLERRGAMCDVSVGDDVLWRGQVSGPMTALAFGETSVDSQHGGEMWLSSVRWNRTRGTTGLP